MNLGYVIGRFNPLHKGHENIIKKMIKENKYHIIFIGSSNIMRTKKNPFSYEERKEMILKVFPEANIINLPDFDDLLEWRENLLKEIDHFINSRSLNNIKNINLYTGLKKGDDVLRSEWLEGTNHNIQPVILKNNINATDIRNNFYNNEDVYSEHLHSEVLNYILNKKEILLEI